MRRAAIILLAIAVAMCGMTAFAEPAFTPADSYDVGERSFNAGAIELTPAGEGGGEVDTVRYAGIAGKDYTDEKVYTYRDTMAATTDLDWNPHTWENTTDGDLMDMMTMGFYTFALNEDRTGYSVIPEMAAEYPVDVTAEYVGQLGVKEGETGKAWRIALNPNAAWSVPAAAQAVIDGTAEEPVEDAVEETVEEAADTVEEAAEEMGEAVEEVVEEVADTVEEAAEEAGEAVEEVVEEVADTVEEAGEAVEEVVEEVAEVVEGAVEEATEAPVEEIVPDTAVPINADDYIYSMQQQLNPKMLNRRADSYYAGQLTIYNAKNYLYSGKTTYDLIEGTAEEALEAGDEVYLDMDFWGITGALDEEGNAAPHYVSIADETLYRDEAVEDPEGDEAWVSAKYLFDNYLAAGAPYEAYQGEYLYTADIAPDTGWDDVGLKKIDDYTIDIILANPIEEAAFYLPYNLASNWLVYGPLYEACKSFYDADGKPVETEEEAETVTTDYCKSLEKTVAYGPYKMTYFELDKQITFSRNDNWYGYSDGKHLGMYQTDIYSLTVIPEHATRLLAFLAGETDTESLQSEDMEKFASSDYIYYSPESYTTKVTFNTDYEKLLEHGTGSQVLVIDEFREAFANAIDRQHFATAFTAAGTAGFGLLNNNYVYNPFTGDAYRTSEAGKKAMVDVYGLTYGEGGDYATLDEAYDALTGYDMAKAQALMATAYDKAVEAGIYDGESPITIDFRVYQNDTIYVQMFTYFDTQLQEACKGSGFEGKVSMTMTVDPDYYETMYSGNADAIFSTWGGASMDPFTMLAGCYTDASDGSGNQMEYGYDTSKIALTFNCNGEDITASLQDWSKWANKDSVPALEEKLGAFADYSYETRCALTAGMEECFLNWYACTPVYYRNSAALRSQKINYAADHYVELVAYGGLAFTTFNYDDAEWAEYIANNELNY